ncbi:MAG TPA: universal stress protein [Anaerolineales bacterium]|nr:universal stress protein [Anaerolineales bacterium]HLE51040.1 universal stress protein [Anaerolineales bacterium]
MFKRILLPLDSSKLAECVLPHLVAIARVCEPEVQLLRVSEPFGVTARLRMIDPVDWQIRKAEAVSYLSGIAARLQNAGLRVSTHLYDGRATEQIIEVAHSWNADLILMSSHGQSGLSPWNVSSVVQQVILRAHRSLMIIRAYQPVTADLTGLRYRKIFLPLDGSQRAEMSLTLAESLARAHSSELLAAHVVRQPELPRRTSASQEDLLLVNQLTERNRAEAIKYLEDLKSRIDMPIQTILEVSPSISRSLHQIADENNVDLTILSAHGYSGDTRWPYGSVGLGFIVYGSTPLLILQDLPTNRIEPTQAEIAARETGGR